MCQIAINLAVEDELSEAILRRILAYSGRPFLVSQCYRRGGFGYLKRMIGGFNNAAKGIPFLVLTDLDSAECPPSLIRDWLPHPKHHNLLFRVAVREVEAWLLVDIIGFASFLGVPKDLIPVAVDSLADPKNELVKLAKRSRKRYLRESIVPPYGSTSKQGHDYNGALIPFVNENWDIEKAIEYSPSLKRTVEIITIFRPVFA